MRDLVNNRGTEIVSGKEISIDTDGPKVETLTIQPNTVIQNNSENPVQVSFTAVLDQDVKEGTTPQFFFMLNRSQFDLEEVQNVTSTEEKTWTFSITLPATAGLEEPEKLVISYSAEDYLSNVSTKIDAEKEFQVFQGDLPALSTPLGFTGKSLPGGKVELSWLAVGGC